MRKRRLLCDVDGVWADFLATAFDILHKITGRRYAATDLHDWDIFQTVPREHEDAFYDAWAVKGTCLSIPVIPGSHDGVKGLQERGDLYVVTSPMTSVETWTNERDRWLHKHFRIPQKHIVHTSAKFLVSGDVLIEDKPSNLVSWLEHNPEGIGILWSQPYNEKVDLGPRVHRARSWQDAFAILDAAPKEDPFASFFEDEKAGGDDPMTVYAEEAKRQGIPGPDVLKHPEGHEGPCLCYECITTV